MRWPLRRLTAWLWKASKQKVDKLPLRISHSDFVKDIAEADRLEMFSRFAETFWHYTSMSASDSPPDQLRFLFRRGFYSDKWRLYDLQRRDPEHFVSDLQGLMLHRANVNYQPVLDNRLLFGHAFSQYFPVPEVHALTDQEGRFVSFSHQWIAASREEPGLKLSVIARPLEAGTTGRTAIFDIRSGSFSGEGETGSLSWLRNMLRDWAMSANSAYILTGNVPQGAFASALNPASVNMLHILLSRDDRSWAPRIDGAILRIGTRSSGPLARIQAGGLSAWIDGASGTVTQCMYLDGDEVLTATSSHPETGATIVGLQVPDWAELNRRLLKLFEESSYLRIAAFDFVLQDAGAVLVGGAHLPDLAGLQVHSPLLRDPRFAEFLRKQKI